LHPYNKVYDYQYIDSQQALGRLCEHYKTLSVIAIDTEFVRTQTLTPNLGLIQVFDCEQVALIDPVAIKDLSAFSDILTDTSIIKVAHSCSEDLEALWHHLGLIPAPIFDTQFAAGLLDLGVSIGYANLVEQLFSVQVDKGESRTDWMQRPLSQAQCEYASADVTHLMALYENIHEQIVNADKLSWVYDEIAQLGLKKSTLFPAHLAYHNIKNNWKLRGKNLAALQLISRWRLELARTQNKSVNFVIKEAAIFEIALKLPTNKQALFDCHNLYSRQAKLYGDALLAMCEQANAMSDADYPPRVQRLVEFSGYKACLAAIKAEIESKALKYELPEAVLASKKQMNMLLKWCWFDFDELEVQGLRPDLINGWRATIIAESLQRDSRLFTLIAEHHEIKRSL
jgi:ribonuclease D